MSASSTIEWTDATWNPVRGCSRISPGCGGANHQGGCYAEKIAARFSGPGQPFEGFAERSGHGGRWTGRMALVDDMLTVPLRWKKPRRIFVNSMSDLFHENLPDETIDKVFAVMALSPQHTFQVLTKRAKRMREYFAERWQGTPAQRFKVGDTVIDMPAGGETGREHQVETACEDIFRMVPAMIDTDNDALWDAKGNLNIQQYKWPLANVWLGVSTEDQERADERIPHLLATPAAVRFISAEPMLGALNLRHYLIGKEHHGVDMSREVGGRVGACVGWTPPLDWVIAGGESGPRARPMHPDWARSLRDQCAAAGVPFFFKQWGEWGPVDPTRKAECHAIGTDGAHYRMSDLAWPDGARRGDAIRADFNKLHPCTTYRVGKKAAGALLDGKLHREFPT